MEGSRPETEVVDMAESNKKVAGGSEATVLCAGTPVHQKVGDNRDELRDQERAITKTSTTTEGTGANN